MFVVFGRYQFKGGMPDLGRNALFRADWKHWVFNMSIEMEGEGPLDFQRGTKSVVRWNLRAGTSRLCHRKKGSPGKRFFPERYMF